MAEKYLIQIQPQVSASDGARMEKDLNSRFANVSKKFGSHLGNSIKNVAKIGLLAVGAAVTGAVLTNPFERINEDLNKTLEKFDNTATRAAEFGVSSGKFFQAQLVAQTVGLDLDMILARFSEGLNRARSGEDPTLKNFLGEKDIIDSFFNFSETLRKLDATARNKVVEDVFGSKLGLRIAELLQTDLLERKKVVSGGRSEGDFTRMVDHVAGVEEAQAIGRAKLSADELFQKGSLITKEVVSSQLALEKEKQNIESIRLTQFDFYAKLSLTQDQALFKLNEISSSITQTIIPRAEKFGRDFTVVSDWFKERKIVKKISEVFK